MPVLPPAPPSLELQVKDPIAYDLGLLKYEDDYRLWLSTPPSEPKPPEEETTKTKVEVSFDWWWVVVALVVGWMLSRK